VAEALPPGVVPVPESGPPLALVVALAVEPGGVLVAVPDGEFAPGAE
jgi:hypothetical protein